MKQHKPKAQRPQKIQSSLNVSQPDRLKNPSIFFDPSFSIQASPTPIQTLQSILMSQSKIINLFKESTQMYCQGNYSACLALLSDCLTLESDRSILYSNRAIANYHLKQLQNSFDDLQKAIKTNHLNYIAYFNLFSLHFLNGNNRQAFKNLCLCLSSAYTILCRMEPSQEFLGQSLYYSCNNKQSLFLLGVLKYEKSQLRPSLYLFKQSLQLEIYQKHRDGIIKHINSIEEQLGEAKTVYAALNTSANFYTLQTSLVCPSQEQFEQKLTKLLKEFNDVYRLINDQMQMEHQFKENTASKISGEKISNIEDKDINRGTAYNSTAYSRAIDPEDQRSTMMLMSHHRDLKLLSTIADDKKIGLEANTEPEEHENYLYPLKKSQQKVKFFIDTAQLNVSIDEEKEKIDSLYAILRYDENGKIFEHRTCILQNNENIKWCEWTDEIALPSKETDLEIKILNKKYTAFKDDLLASGRISIKKSGSLSVPLFHNQQCNGSILLTVEAQ